MTTKKQEIKDQSLEQSMEAAAAVATVVEQNPQKLLVQELEGELNSPKFFWDDNDNSSGKQQQQRFIAK